MCSARLSVCIPTYNRADMLGRTLDALCAEKWPFEVDIVVSDNASPDHTQKVLEGFPVRSFRQKETIEAIDNYFSAVRAARGEFAFYLADDDAVVPEALARAVGQMQAHPQWAASFSPYLETEQGTDRELQTINPVEAPFEIAPGDFCGALRFLMSRFYHAETPLVRAETFRRFVTRSRKMWYSHWMLACFLKSGGVGMLSEPVFKHRIRNPFDHPQLQWEYAVDGMDRNRLGLEYFAFLAERQNGGRLPEDIGSRLADFFIERFTAYADVAVRVCQAQGDYQAGAEFATRLALWRSTDVMTFDRQSMEARVDAELEKRKRTAGGELAVVDSSAERDRRIAAGADASLVIAREDLRKALSIG